MADILESFINRIDNDIENTFNPRTGYGTVDVWILLQYLALDIIAETAFGGTFHLLDGNDHLVPQVVNQNMKLASHVRSYQHVFTSLHALFIHNAIDCFPSFPWTTLLVVVCKTSDCSQCPVARSECSIEITCMSDSLSAWLVHEKAYCGAHWKWWSWKT